MNKTITLHGESAVKALSTLRIFGPSAVTIFPAKDKRIVMSSASVSTGRRVSALITCYEDVDFEAFEIPWPQVQCWLGLGGFHKAHISDGWVELQTPDWKSQVPSVPYVGEWSPHMLTSLGPKANDEASTMFSCISTVSSSASTDDTRPRLQSVLVYVGTHDVTAYATDGHTAMTCSSEWHMEEPQSENAVAEFALPACDVDVMRTMYGNRFLYGLGGSGKVTSVAVTGCPRRHPGVEAVFSAAENHPPVLDIGEMFDGWEGHMKVSPFGLERAIKLACDAAGVVPNKAVAFIRSETEKTARVEVLKKHNKGNASGDGSAVFVLNHVDGFRMSGTNGFNPYYFLRVLKEMRGESILFRQADEDNKAMFFKPEEEGHLGLAVRAVVMNMRLTV
jgi:hypothetical protein